MFLCEITVGCVDIDGSALEARRQAIAKVILVFRGKDALRGLWSSSFTDGGDDSGQRLCSVEMRGNQD
jgi:hypothetical protein